MRGVLRSLLVAAVAVILLVVGAALILRSSNPTGYASRMRPVWNDFVGWTDSMDRFLGNLDEDNLSNAAIYWCNTGDYARVRDDGAAILRRLQGIQPPTDVAKAHRGLIGSMQSLLGHLAEADTAFCTRRNNAAADRSLSAAAGSVGELAAWARVIQGKVR
jgi:hypothetical protein